jgi:hypothetical protein
MDERSLFLIGCMGLIVLVSAVVFFWRGRSVQRGAPRDNDESPQPSLRPPSSVLPPAPLPPAPPEPVDHHKRLEAAPELEAPLDDAPAQSQRGPAVRSGLTAEPVRFSGYYPREAAPQVWTPLRAYAFRHSAAEVVEADAARALGDRRGEYRPVRGESRTALAEGALITATPELPGVQFNPPSASVALYEDWHVLEFKLRAADAALEQAVNGRLTFTVEGLIVADLPLSIFVTAAPGSAGASAPANASADPYDAVFCSYSHQDSAIVERLERAYRALGFDYLRDVTALRSGEDWDDRLLALIDEADIFQLFWSNAAAASPYVRQEWEYALALQRSGAFIRPVYWQQPMPKAPAPLSELHFHYDATLAQSH